MDPQAQQIIELYKHPLNRGRTEGADIVKIGINLSCGDQVSMYIKLKVQSSKFKIQNSKFRVQSSEFKAEGPKVKTADEKSKVIELIMFEGTGCSVSVASASLLTEMLKGKTLGEVLSWGAKEIEEMLGIELGPSRLKCALLPLDTIQEGIKEFEG